MSMVYWKLTDEEWRKLEPILAVGRLQSRRRGSTINDRKIAEACIYYYYHRLARTRCRGWNRLPTKFRQHVSPATANRRFKKWNEVKWSRGRDLTVWDWFWESLMRMRHPLPEIQLSQRKTRQGIDRAANPVAAIVLETQAAYDFFNARFFGSRLPTPIAITLERPIARRRLGCYRSSSWRRGTQAMDEITLSTSLLGKGAATVFEVLLHEMVHLWNARIARVPDCDPRTQYHNQFFRYAARHAGLQCSDTRDPSHGWMKTRLSQDGQQALRDFKPDDDLFMWAVG